MLNMQVVLQRLETLESQVKYLLSSKGSNMSSTVTTIESGAVGAVETAAAVQQAVASQSDILDKIEAGLSEFFQVAPPIVAAVDPSVSTPVTAIATAISGLLGVLKQLHDATVKPAANAVTAASQAHPSAH